MDIRILTDRYSTPMYIKIIGTLLFPALLILMLAMPVFELIPLETYGNIFNHNGVATGSYESDKYSIFSMLKIDYCADWVTTIFVVIAVLAVNYGILLLWINRPKMAMAPAAILFVEIIFSIFRSPDVFYNIKGRPDAPEFWQHISDTIASQDSTKDAQYFIHEYHVNGKTEIFNRFGYYWVLWIAGIVLIGFLIFAIVKTKTLIEKKK
ncbi:MAG: hypothetical protein VZR54_09110 [Ruminococcus sp.]|nr:hypothetical protein [Ruminococcus sp.]